MNEFYSIANPNSKPIDQYQLENLGDQMIFATFVTPRRNTWDGFIPGRSSHTYRQTTPEDYDNQFVQNLFNSKPVYELTKILDYHFDQYQANKSNPLQFFEHLQYVIIPIVKKRQNGDVVRELINKWIDKKQPKKVEEKKSFNFQIGGSINAPSQFQINSDNSNQKLDYSSAQIIELLEYLRKDVGKLSDNLRDEFNYEISKIEEGIAKKNNFQTRLLTLGVMIRDVGINTFSNLLASPIFETMKPYMGL